MDMFINISLILAQLWTFGTSVICDINKVNLYQFQTQLSFAQKNGL